MQGDGRRRVDGGAIVSSGIRVGLARLSVRAVAQDLQVSEMTIYRHTGGAAGLRQLVIQGILSRMPSVLPSSDDPETALVALARALREFVHTLPGVAQHLAALQRFDVSTLSQVEESQRAFAERFGWEPATASILVSTVAEHAVALAELDPRTHRVQGDPDGLPPEFRTIRAGARMAAEWGPEARFEWSMRATVRGAMSMLGIAPSAPAPAPAPAPEEHHARLP